MNPNNLIIIHGAGMVIKGLEWKFRRHTYHENISLQASDKPLRVQECPGKTELGINFVFGKL